MKATTSQRLRYKAANKVNPNNVGTFEDRLNKSINAAKDKIEKIFGPIDKWEVNTQSKSDRYQYLTGYFETNKWARLKVGILNNSLEIDSMKTVTY